MVVGAQTVCMELVKENEQQSGLSLTEDIVQKVMIPHLDLQSIARFSQTCKTYKEVFEPGKIQHRALGLFKVQEDYYRCTQALSRYAHYKNKIMFNFLWEYDVRIRDENVIILEPQLDINLCDKMNVYRSHYGNLENVDKNITQQLKKAIETQDNEVLHIITESKKYNIFDLFNDDAIELAFENICQQSSSADITALLALLPVEKGKQKNRAVQYISKYDRFGTLLRTLMEKEYLIVNEEYGHQCTLLHYAALHGWLKLTQTLINKKANVHAVNEWGKKPLDYAYKYLGQDSTREYGYNVVIRLFESSGSTNYGMQPSSMITESCYCDFSEEEAAWLRRACPYSLEKK